MTYVKQNYIILNDIFLINFSNFYKCRHKNYNKQIHARVKIIVTTLMFEVTLHKLRLEIFSTFFFLNFTF